MHRHLSHRGGFRCPPSLSALVLIALQAAAVLPAAARPSADAARPVLSREAAAEEATPLRPLQPPLPVLLPRPDPGTEQGPAGCATPASLLPPSPLCQALSLRRTVWMPALPLYLLLHVYRL